MARAAIASGGRDLSISLEMLSGPTAFPVGRERIVLFMLSVVKGFWESSCESASAFLRCWLAFSGVGENWSDGRSCGFGVLKAWCR